MAPPSARLRNISGGHLIGVIGDEDTITGFLMAGVGHVEASASTSSNYFVTDSSTPVSAIEEAFKRLTDREDIAILLINQFIANKIRANVAAYKEPVPAILEIPSKEHPYDPNHDSILQRVRGMLGSG